MIENFINYINNNNNNNNNNLIILEKDLEIIEIQKELCKKLNNCYIYNNYFTNEDYNIGYIIYNNKIFIILKQMIKRYYIKNILNI